MTRNLLSGTCTLPEAAVLSGRAMKIWREGWQHGK